MKVYPVLSQAQALSGLTNLDILEGRSHGVPLMNDLRRWFYEQPPHELLVLDFQGARAITASFAMEVGPVLMQLLARAPALDQRYPVYKLDNPEHAYTFALVFAAMNWAGLSMLGQQIDRYSTLTPLGEYFSSTIAVLGSLTTQMERILMFADQLAAEGKYLTSELLTSLDFQKAVTAGARSKRLTDLYERRLLQIAGEKWT